MAAEKSSTHKKILKKAIEDETIQIVGITGLGGVGKTTLASEVAVKMKNQFAQIVFATITATVDTKTIRKKIEVATRRRLSKGEKILIILDDMREELKLDELLGREEMMNCKILITSRSKDVCEAMNAQEVITVSPLEEEEACALFEQAVGKNVWQEDSLKELALEIVKECCGLPLLIQAVGSALKNKGITSWETMRNRLQDPTEEHQRKGMNQLKLSYDYLESEVAKSCFLLCSMFPEDSLISLATLTYYGLALGIFDNPDDHISIQDARRKVQVAIDSLKSSFLLLPRGKFDDGRKEETFKMHDLVRDMAILITSGGNYKFWVESGKSLSEWEPETHLESCKKISLMRNYISKLPDHELVFPQLDTFLIQDNQMLSIPDEFFQGVQKLKILDMSGNKFSSLPRSLTQLTELHTLDLSANVPIVDISILGELTCLEILKLRATRITHIPEEIGQLSNLRLLDLYLCSRLVYVTPGVISKLTRLAELYVQMSMEGKWNFLVELSKLESLKVLHLAIHKLEYIPEDFHIKTSLEFYVTDDYTFHPGHRSLSTHRTY